MMLRAPSPTTAAAAVRIEPMSAAFTKFHVAGPCVLHRFTAPDVGDPHDHPWGFTSHVLAGGYVEEIFTPTGDSWTCAVVERRAGESHAVAATTIHRIIALMGPECWTLVEPGPATREAHFWRATPGGIEARPWHGDYPGGGR